MPRALIMMHDGSMVMVCVGCVAGPCFALLRGRGSTAIDVRGRRALGPTFSAVDDGRRSISRPVPCYPPHWRWRRASDLRHESSQVSHVPSVAGTRVPDARSRRPTQPEATRRARAQIAGSPCCTYGRARFLSPAGAREFTGIRAKLRSTYISSRSGIGFGGPCARGPRTRAAAIAISTPELLRRQAQTRGRVYIHPTLSRT
ncbi:hypothetical protein GGX14DRAFT_571010 [Mycena pura]|uniref:Uncharacterized protein n=1 Tax=Mycena pura TaxID=153505 RepID=A0AAD6V454_9AGAR|nr:hypothetical protein GGX14DRAFT_571010 [Mycena pura]